MTGELPKGTFQGALSALGWRPEDFADRLNAFASQQGRSERIDRKTPFKWRDKAQKPRRPWPDLAAALLSEHLGRTITPDDLGWVSAGSVALPAGAGLNLPWTAQGGLHAARTVADAVDMRRRLFLTLMGTAMTAPAHEWLIAHAAGDAAARRGRHLPDGVIDNLQDITSGLRRMDDQLGGGQLLTLANTHLRTVIDLLENRCYNESTGKRLHATAGEILRLCGWLSFDSGRHPQAQRYWIAALREAHAGADLGLGANILGFMSCQAKDLGQYREATTLAETALAGYPGNAPQVAAILAFRAAEAYANAGSLNACRAQIDTAFDRLRDHQPQHGAPEWAYWLDGTHANGQAGYCYLRLEQWNLARQHFRNALNSQPNTNTREGALRQVLLAITYAGQPNPDLPQAVHLGERAVATLNGQVDSSRVGGHIARLVNRLQPYRKNSAVRIFTDHAHQRLATHP